jgi:hypothetical protein
VIAMVVAFVTAPLIAWATKGRYYLARTHLGQSASLKPCVATEDMAGAPLAKVIRLRALHRCT